jgi:hypothetical protein
MTPLLAALLLVAQPRIAGPVPLDLDQFMDRAEALNGRWVEFDAYVILMRRPGNQPTLNALTGETRTLEDGTSVILCADNPEATVAVLLARNGFGPLSRRAARPRNANANAYVGVRLRGILRGRPYSFRVGNFEQDWVGSVDNARIVSVTGGRCLINLPR